MITDLFLNESTRSMMMQFSFPDGANAVRP